MEEFLLSKGYELGTQIGRGGFATVFQGQHQDTQKNVAIKIIDKAYVRRHDLVDRVAEEIKIHSRLEHPSVVKLLEWFEDPVSVYLVLELCENGELQTYMKARGRPFGESEAREIMWQVIDGFIYLHSQGIIHRDLSLANILITRDMRLKICDFGLAKQLSRPDERHLTLCGTPNFISPEVAMRSSHGLETDVWGLGILLYTLLVGKPPFETEGVKSTLTKVVMTDYRIPSHLSTEAKDLISKLLKKVPKERMRLKDIKTHPFFTQPKLRLGKGSIASSDSGVYTMTTVSDSSRNISENQMLRRLERDYNMPHLNLDKQPVRRSHSASSRIREPLAPIREGLSRQQSFDEKCHNSTENLRVTSDRGFSDQDRFTGNRDSERIENKLLNPASEREGRRTPESFFDKAPLLDPDEKRTFSNSLYERQREKNIQSDAFRQVSSEKVPFWEGKDRLAPPEPEYLRPRDGSSERRFDSTPCARQEVGLVRTPSCDRLSERDLRAVQDRPRSRENVCGPLFKGGATEHPSQPRTVERVRSLGDAYEVHGFSPRDRDQNMGVSNPIRGNGHSYPVTSSHLSCPGELAYTAPQQKTNCSHIMSCPGNCAHFNACGCHVAPRECPSADRLWNANAISVATNHSAPPALHHSPRREWGSEKAAELQKKVQTGGMATPALCTARLKATRQKTKNVIMQIMDNGEVCLEFIKDRKGLERVVDVCRISCDGLRVAIYQPNGNRGIPISETAAPIPAGGADFIYSYENLPSRFWKKYEYASRFVMLVKAKTPKVTYYSVLAKCFLMENSPNNDFEVNFYKGTRIVKTQSGVNLCEIGQPSKLLPVNDPSKLSGDSRKLYEHYLECYDYCSRYETLLEQLVSNSPDLFFFPVIFGRKPSQSSGNLRLNDNKENLSPTMSSMGSAIHMPSFGTSVATSSSRQSFKRQPSQPDRRQLIRTKGINDISVIAGYLGGAVRRADVPGLGRVIEQENGEIDIYFLDKYELTISPHTAAIRVRRPTDSKTIDFPPCSVLPDDLEHRLSFVPKFIECLKKLPPGIR